VSKRILVVEDQPDGRQIIRSSIHRFRQRLFPSSLPTPRPTLLRPEGR
jgi:hypothetical protein